MSAWSFWVSHLGTLLVHKHTQAKTYSFESNSFLRTKLGLYNSLKSVIFNRFTCCFPRLIGITPRVKSHDTPGVLYKCRSCCLQIFPTPFVTQADRPLLPQPIKHGMHAYLYVSCHQMTLWHITLCQSISNQLIIWHLIACYNQQIDWLITVCIITDYIAPHMC